MFWLITRGGAEGAESDDDRSRALGEGGRMSAFEHLGSEEGAQSEEEADGDESIHE